MNRRYYLRLVGVGAGVGTAGCLDFGGAGESTETTDEPGSTETTDEPGSTEGTDLPTQTPPMEETGRIEENEVRGLAFDGWWSSVIREEDLFQIQMQIRNAGERTTEVDEYDLRTAVYDDTDTELESEPVPTEFAVTELGPGDGVTVTTGRTLDDPGTVARYTISLRCPADSNGVYCRE